MTVKAKEIKLPRHKLLAVIEKSIIKDMQIIRLYLLRMIQGKEKENIAKAFDKDGNPIEIDLKVKHSDRLKAAELYKKLFADKVIADHRFESDKDKGEHTDADDALKKIHEERQAEAKKEGIDNGSVVPINQGGKR